MLQAFMMRSPRRCLGFSHQLPRLRLASPIHRQHWSRVNQPEETKNIRTFDPLHATLESNKEQIREREESVLFNYTKGRFLLNEESRLAERKRPFNISEFKALAAKSIGRHPDDVVHLEKLADGSLNRVFLITMRGGFEFVGRIPYVMLEPQGLVTASEVATMDFLRLHGLPVPQIFDYSDTPNNGARTEYIFMERVPGKCLGDIWYSGSVPQEDKIRIVKQLVELESRMFGLRFPASGSLYYSNDVEDGVKLDYTNPHARGSFCIGPDTDRALWWGRRSDLAVDCGPYLDTQAAISAGAKKEMAYLKEFGQPLLPYHRKYREFCNYEKQPPQAYRKLLETFLYVAPHLIPEGASARPVLRHPSLSPYNVIVSPQLEITGLIGWQHCSVRPLFLQSGIPDDFRNRTYLEADDLKDEPCLPAYFESLDEAEQARRVKTWRSQQLHHAYISATKAMNPEHMDVMAVPANDVRRKLCLASAQPWLGDDFPLKMALVHMSRDWGKLWDKAASAPEACPVQFTESETQQAFEMFEQRRDADMAFAMVRTLIGLDDPSGEVPSAEYEEVKRCADDFKVYSAGVAGEESEEDKMEVLENWYFNDFDEEQYK
ncbi:kinase-like domain-containing protein [Phyllosticta capitalensis]